jgi:phosphoglycerate kinase
VSTVAKSKPLPLISKENGLRGKRILVRAALDVTLDGDGAIDNDYRIEAALKTLEFLHTAGARVVVVSHIGRDPERSLRPVAESLAKRLPLSFYEETVGPVAEEKANSLHDGEVLLLENLRRHDGEVSCDESFTQQLSRLGEIYVNDAFSASHRAHASIVGVPKFLPSFAGLQFSEEVTELSAAFNPLHFSVCVLGGAKFETKSPLIEKFLENYDMVFVGGALANDFFRARGFEVGRSMVSDTLTPVEKLMANTKLMLPSDVVVVDAHGRTEVKHPNEVAADEMIVDAGPETGEKLAALIRSAGFVLWNGPFGECEKGFTEQTSTFIRSVQQSKAYTLAGGGDTVKTITKLNARDIFSFISTGGGAMLEYLLKGTLPGIDALRQRH